MEGDVKLLILGECIRVLRCSADGTQHSWCTSVHSELKSIGPISICPEYISFVLHFSRLKWSRICDDISFHWRETQYALRFRVDAEPCKLIFFYLHSCWVPSSFFSSSTARHWSPWGLSSRPPPNQRWRPAASLRLRCYCCPPIPSLCPSVLHLGAPHTQTWNRQINGRIPKTTHKWTNDYISIVAKKIMRDKNEIKAKKTSNTEN